MLTLVEDKELHPGQLAEIMNQTLSQLPRSSVTIDLNGAENTAKWLELWEK
jgi:hypothetical protein